MSRDGIGRWAVVALWLLFGVAYALRTPPWQAPDEPAHYRYVAQLAAGQMPRMESADYDQAAQAAAVSDRFGPDSSLDAGFSYEDYQPPLYYLLLTPVFRLTEGNLYALRLVSVLLGAGVVWLAHGCGRLLFPQRPWLALTLALFVALLPQHLAILSTLNNDALAVLLVAALLWLLLRHPVGRSPRADLLIGFLLGLTFLTKVTASLMAGVIGLLWLGQGFHRGTVRSGVRLFAPALALGLLWWVRNALVYPGPDFLGVQMHDAVVTGQLKSAEWIADRGLASLLTALLQTTFRSFWGQFGWMAAPFPGWVWPPLWLFSALVGAGLIVSWTRRARWSAERRRQVTILALLVGFNLALYLTYNVQYVQHQGRYFFVSLIPLAAGVAVGSGFWWGLVARYRPMLWWLLPVALAVGLAGLNLFALLRILPCLRHAAC
jgi:4-amino-4-deoxy-L-arabinose transferase-like glycosyltransferase